MQGLVKRIARQTLYSSGPKNGELTKVRPDAKTAQGIQPGAGQRFAAEEFNYLLSQQTRAAALQAANAFTMRKLPYPFGIPGSIAWHPPSGEFVSNTLAAEIVSASESRISVLSGSGEFQVGARKTFVRQGGRVLALGRSASAIDHLKAVSAFSGVSGFFDLNLAGGFEVHEVSACWDKVSDNAIIAVYTAATASPALGSIARAFRVAQPGATILEASSFVASTGPVVRGSARIATGGGTTLLLYRQDTPSPSDQIRLIRSTDGGDVWASITPPAISTGFQNLQYVEDFLAEGPAFVIVGAAAVYFSRDGGTSWLSIAVSETYSLILGDFLFGLDDAALLARDLASGFAFNLSFAENTSGTLLLTDGYRLYAADTGNNDLFVSGWLVPPPNPDGTDQDF